MIFTSRLPQLGIAAFVLTSSCHRERTSAQIDASSSAIPSTTIAATPSASATATSAVVDTGRTYARVAIEKIGDPNWDGTDIEIETVFEPPRLVPTGDPHRICEAVHVLGQLGFPNVDTPGAPGCFILEKGALDPASVTPHVVVRARARGRFHFVRRPHSAPHGDDSTFLDLDSFEVIPEPDYAAKTIEEILKEKDTAHLEKVAVEGQWYALGFESPWMLREIDPKRAAASICLVEQNDLGRIRQNQSVRLRGHVFVRTRAGTPFSADTPCGTEITVESYDTL